MSHGHVRAELLLPHEIEARLALRSVVYLPLGSIEYHSHHLPLGLDGLNAHGVCVRAADTTGGVVLPVQYVGTGGTHTAYPWTLMAADPAPLVDLLGQTLRRLADLGVAQAVLFTGHFADEQLAMIDDVAAGCNAAGAGPHVLALAVNRTDARLPPDHAGVSRAPCCRRCTRTGSTSRGCPRSTTGRWSPTRPPATTVTGTTRATRCGE